MDYITTQQASEKWGISKRRVQVLCREARIEGATRMGVFWIIPRESEKPVDERKKGSKAKK